MEWDWNILVGFGTLALAISTFVVVYQNRIQLDLFKKQILMQSAELKPYLFIKHSVIIGNNIILGIENGGNAAAYELGLEMRYFIIADEYYDKQKDGREISLGEAIQQKKQGAVVYHKYRLLAPDQYPKLFHNGEEVKISEAITFFTPQGISKYFPPHHIYDIQTTPLFMLDKIHTESSERYMLDFDKLVSFMLLNDKLKVGVSMNLICKDMTGKAKGQGYICSFVIDSTQDKTLEESSKNTYRFEQLPVDLLSGDIKGIAMTRKDYENSHSL